MSSISAKAGKVSFEYNDGYDPVDCSEDVTKLVQALARITKDLGAIPKADRSPGEAGNYLYRGIEGITAKLAPLLAREGVVIVPHGKMIRQEPSPAMKDGWVDVYLKVNWRIYGPDGAWISASTAGIGRDKSDKGANKAQTQAFKYLLLELFCIADGDSDTDGIAYEPHVDVSALPKVISKEAQDDLLGRIGVLEPDFQEQLVKWFRENECPPVKRLTEDRLDDVELILSHFENLSDYAIKEREMTSDGPVPG